MSLTVNHLPGGAGGLALAIDAHGAASDPPALPPGVEGRPRPAGSRPAANGRVASSAAPLSLASARSSATPSSSTKTSRTRPRSASGASSSRSTTGKTGYAPKAAADAALAFLDDPKLGIEDKLMMFMARVQARFDQQIRDQMKLIEAKQAGKASGASAGSAGGAEQPKKSKGLFGKLGDAFGAAVGGLGKVLTGPRLKEILKQVGGPLLAAAATAVGLPQLAPLALALGKELGGAVGSAVASALRDGEGPASSKSSSSTAGASSSSSTSKAAAGAGGTVDGEYNEQLAMMQLQRMMERQKEMFTLVSNALRTLHDTSMTAIHNVR